MKSIVAVIGLIGLLTCSGCSGFLEEYSQDEIRPAEVSDVEQLLLGNAYLDPNNDKKEVHYAIMDIFTDDIQCNGLDMETRRTYFEQMKWRFLWKDDMFAVTGGGYDKAFWGTLYEKILGCNIVLDCLDDMRGNDKSRENLRGEALVLRSWYYLILVNMYGMPYNEGDPTKNLGIPLKLSMEVKDQRFPRTPVSEVYTQLEQDLLKGNRLLTQNDVKRNFYRINHLAAKALLSRMYLYMENWDKALAYADTVLQVKPELLDFNQTSWDYAGSYPTPCVYNPEQADEVIWMREGYLDRPDFESGPHSYSVSSTLLDLYGPCENRDMVTEKKIKDIRANVYFNWTMNSHTWKYERAFLSIGGVTYSALQGIRTAEMYLNRAEVYIRKYMKEGNEDFRIKALKDLNELRRHRFNSAFPYEEIDIRDANELFDFYKDERRRELAGDGQHRWCDLRRYGMPEIEHILFEKPTDNKTRVTLHKNRYVLPIPDEAIRANPLLEQNK